MEPQNEQTKLPEQQGTSGNELLYNCPICEGMLSRNALVCPHCGDPKKTIGKLDTFLTMAILYMIGLAALLVWSYSKYQEAAQHF